MAFLCGILLVQQLAELPPGWLSLLLFPLAVLGWWRRALLPLVFLASGSVWVSLHAGMLLHDSLPAELVGQDVRVTGRIADLPHASDRSLRFLFAVSSAHLEERSVKIPSKIQATLYDPNFIAKLGDEWEFTVRLKPPHGFLNPGGFDYEGHLFHERIRATGYVRASPAPRRINSGPFSYPLGRIRQALSENIRRALPNNDFAGMVTAFANGDENGISPAQWQVLQRTGTTHLIAISGMNIGLVAGIVFFLMRWLWALPGFTVLRLPAPKFAALAALLAAFGYSALAGFAIPTQRAMIMLAVVMGALLINRRPLPSQLLATALFVVLLCDPLAVMSAGFWLSFGAIGVILLAMHGRMAEQAFMQWGRLQWVVAIGLLPMMLALFQQTSLSGPFANMLAIPAIEIIVIPVTLLGVIALAVLPDAIAFLLLNIAAWTMSILWLALDYLAGLEHTLWVQHAPPGWTLAWAAFATALLLAPRGWPARWLGVIGLLPLFLIRPGNPAPGELWFTLLDVGQGLAAVARTQHHTLVFDTGPRFSERFDTGRAVVTPYLRHSGVDRIDMLVISHGDNDHIGGALSLLADFPRTRILTSVPDRLPDAQHCIAGQAWNWDGVEFRVLNPADASETGNNASCVLRISSAYGTVLLTGDIEAEAEERLLDQHRSALGADILVVPHHGSKTSSTTAFIAAVKPSLALLPLGYKNRYGHPHASVIARYTRAGVRLLDSPAQGAITLKLGAAGRQISGYRQTHQRYWLAQ